MLQTILKNKILITVLVLVIGALGYYFLFPSEVVTRGIVIDPVDAKARDDVLSALRAYDSFEFTSGVFATDAYKSLEDMTSSIPNQSPGRVDPFAPVR